MGIPEGEGKSLLLDFFELWIASYKDFQMKAISLIVMETVMVVLCIVVVLKALLPSGLGSRL